MTEHLVEQTGFPGVGPADDRRANPSTQNLPLARRAEQFVHEPHSALEAGQQLVARFRGNIFVREVDVRLDMSQRFQEIVAQLVDALRQSAGELLVGRGQGQFRARADQVGHGFRLGEVQAPVEKRALGELARLSQARSVFQQRVQHQLRGQDASVAGDLDGVLAREGPGRAHDG